MGQFHSYTLRLATHDKVCKKISSTHKDLTNSEGKKCADHVCVPKETLKSCKTNPFDSGPDKISTIDVKVCSKIVFGLLQHLEQGNKMFQNL